MSPLWFFCHYDVIPAAVPTFSDFEPMVEFSQDILDKIVSEGEQRLAAQLQVAIAADQRSLVFAGFQIASMTLVAGGLVAIYGKADADVPLLLIGLFFVASLLIGTFKTIDTVRPALFSFPGNCPRNWFIADWHYPSLGYNTATLKHASVEQAFVLDQCIAKNIVDMEQRAATFKLAIDITYWAVAFCGILAISRIIFRSLLAT